MKKAIIGLGVTLGLTLIFVMGFASDPVVVPEGYKALADQIRSAMTDNLKSETIRKGADLQYMAKTYYGDSLGWPLVWFFNTDTVANPEVVEAGTKLKIPRLKAGIDPREATKALENAYMLVYYLYANDGKHSKAQRQWVLGQARSAGLDLKAQTWAGVLSDEDLAWVNGQKANTATKKVVIPTAVVLDVKQTKAVIALAAKADEKALEELIFKAQTNNALDDLQGDLEAEAAKPEADNRPEIHFALALTYGRKGLKTQEYAALVKAEEAAKKPGVNFNVTIIYGRKQLLENDVDADKFLVGSLKVENAPEGASIFIDGIEVGKTPKVITNIKAGKHRFKLSHEWYEEGESDQELEIVVGRETKQISSLVMKQVDFDYTTNAEASLVILKNLDKPDEEQIKVSNKFTPVSVNPGRYLAKIEGTNKKDIFEEIEIKPGQAFNKNWNMELGEHEWQITSNVTGAKVLIDGGEIGRTPLKYVLFPGKHKLQIEAEGYVNVLKDVDFTAYELGRGYRYNQNLSRLIPTKSITIDGKNDDWSGVEMVKDNNLIADLHANVSGDHVVRFGLAQDKDALYVYLEFDDGVPQVSGAIGNFVVQFIDADGYQIRLGIDRNQGASRFGQSINVQQPEGKNSKRLWGGDNSNFTIIGTNFLESRFPRKIIMDRLNAASDKVPTSLELHVLYAGNTYAYNIMNLDTYALE